MAWINARTIKIGSARSKQNGPAVATNNCYPGLTTKEEWLQMSLPVSARESISAKPLRLADPEEYRSSGRWHRPQTYVVGWQDGIVKVGYTSHGCQRWGGFLTRGGIMLDIGYYKGVDAVYAETWLQEKLDAKYLRAFTCKEEATPYLGANGAGYLECFRIPVSDWPALIELARS